MLSVILLSYFSGNRIPRVYHSLSRLLNQEGIPFEFIVIDDGSTDNSYLIASELEKNQSNVFAYQLSKNYTSHYAIFAGLSVCNGNCAVSIPDDEQQPYDTIVDMYRLWEKGEKIIIPFRERRNDGVINDFFSNLYYATINKFSKIRFPKGGADTCLIDREVIDILNTRIHPINTSSIFEVLKLGFSPYYFPYHRLKGVNLKSRWTWSKKIRLFKDTFFISSTWPIKAITSMGIVFSVFAFLVILFYIYIRLFGNPEFWGKIVPGWTSLVIIISFFSGLILFSLGIIAEYTWRIYEEVKNRPGFIIKKKKN